MRLVHFLPKEVFVCKRSRHFISVETLIKVIFPIGTLTWRISILVSSQRKGKNRRNERVK